MSVDDKEVVLGNVGAGFLAVDFFLRASLRGVILHEVSEVVRRNEVVDCHDVDLLAEEALVANCTEDEAADAAETIDANFNHETLSILQMMTKKSGSKEGVRRSVNN
jgi:hypothetical protein